MGDSWTTIESDPGVFTELITAMGVKGVQVEEVYSLDQSTLADMRPTYGLIFLFKWQKETDNRPTQSAEEYIGKVFFAEQVITNACATQALLSVLLNRPDIELGKELTDLQNFTSDFSASLKGHAISNSDAIRNAHNSFRPPNPIIAEESMEGGKEEDVYHFISYVPIQGFLYELDGLKPGPIQLGPCSEEDWVSQVQPFIQQRMERYSASEIRFNLLALIRDRREVYREQLAELGLQSQAETGEMSEADLQANELQERLSHEEAKFKQWHKDNQRRRNNYITFVFNLLRILAEENKLHSLIEKAQVPKQIQQQDQ